MWSKSRDAEASFWDTHSWPREPGQERKESTVNTCSIFSPSQVSQGCVQGPSSGQAWGEGQGEEA